MKQIFCSFLAVLFVIGSTYKASGNVKRWFNSECVIRNSELSELRWFFN